MKTTKSLFSSLVKGVFRGRRKKSAAMESYLKCIPTIQKLIDRHQLGINLKERTVVVDVSLHMAFLPAGSSASAWKQADRRYAAFFNKVVAYMNFKLGQLGKKDFIDTDKEPVHFIVTQKETVMWENNEPVPAHLQVREKAVIVGRYENGIVDYKAVEDGQM